MIAYAAGALFDNGDNELRSSFSYEMISQNKRAARFRLSSETLRIDNDDSYAVGAASMYRVDRRKRRGKMSTLPTGEGVFTTLKIFDIPTPSPTVRVLTRTLIGSMLFSAIGGYCIGLNCYSRVY